MKNIQPISALRNTNQLEKDLKEENGLIYITKNGYSHFVIMSPEKFEETTKNNLSLNKMATKHEQYENCIKESKDQSDPLGFVRVRAATIDTKVGAVHYNAELIKKEIKKAAEDEVKILCLPELCLTAYTCEDLFFTDIMNQQVHQELESIRAFTKDYEVFVTIGAPLAKANTYYNCAVAMYHGEILGVVPKSHIPNYGEFYEKRHFAKAPNENHQIHIGKRQYPFGTSLLFVDEDYLKLKIGIEICEDAWVPEPPSTGAALAGANIILNLSASNEAVGKKEFRSNLVRMFSARLNVAYVYADAGIGESSTDLVFGSHNIIAENGKILEESELFSMNSVTQEIDLDSLMLERRKVTSFPSKNEKTYKWIKFSMPLNKPSKLVRKYNCFPFIPYKNGDIDLETVNNIIKMQAMGLLRRLRHIGTKKVYIGLSGGLDSTLALLVAVEAFKYAGWDLKGIYAITLPAFGTSRRTHDNAVLLADELGVSFDEINIKDAVLEHFKSTGHDPEVHNVAYENAQARMRTMVLMDIANERGGIMIGTGDLSELCLGWCTYGGDHMSMYGVNASIPKTLVQYLVKGYAQLHDEAYDSLIDIVNTPISPELLPPKGQDGKIEQKTEDVIGPYELNDFFIYYFLRYGFTPRKLYYLASQAFGGKYDKETLKYWLKNFFKRFFNSQFKRSCLPDGAKVGTIAVSPRGDLRMPSDASAEDYINEIDLI